MAFGILRDLVGDRHAHHPRQDPASLALLGADEIPVFERNGLGRIGLLGLSALLVGLFFGAGHLDPILGRQRRQRHRRWRNFARLRFLRFGPATARLWFGNRSQYRRRRRRDAWHQFVLQHIDLRAFFQLLETGGRAIRIGVHVERLEYSRGAL